MKNPLRGAELKQTHTHARTGMKVGHGQGRAGLESCVVQHDLPMAYMEGCSIQLEAENMLPVPCEEGT